VCRGYSGGTNGANGKDWDPCDPLYSRPVRLLDERIPLWRTEVREAINQLITTKGSADCHFNAAKRPVAVFDWDNTVMKNDIGDATMFWMLLHNKILQPPNKDWSTTSAFLTDAAKAALNLACDDAAAPGAPLPTSTTAGCLAEIFNIYYNAKTVAQAAAWTTELTLTNNAGYAWASQLQMGYTPEEIRSFARAAFAENNAATVAATQSIGGASVAGYVRIYEQIRDLALTLRDNGFEVWIVSASPQYNIEAVAEEIGVMPDHVIGIRPVLVNGVISSNFLGCGSVADGGQTLITFDQGKRCWINKAIFRQPASAQEATNPDAAQRPTFVAGDSDGDIAMLKDATALKLVINRNKTQIMCNACANVTGNWAVQPMFLQPKPQKTSGYSCSTAKDAADHLIVDEQGNPIPDQIDCVYQLPN
jgi:hypothetical protein